MVRHFACGLLALVIVGPASADTEELTAGVQRLGTAGDRYLEVQMRGGWQAVPPGPSLHPGERNPAVPMIRARLTATGDLLATGTALPPIDPEVYDDGLVAAVRAFQSRHGLVQDGVVGTGTRAAMNVPVADRIAQLELNRDRVEHEPHPAGRHIRVNIPGYRLELLNDDTPVLDMPVVVGRRDRSTPLIESAITWMVFNPSWTVPTKLAYEDLLPKMRRDPTYFSRSGIQVYDSWHAGAGRVDPGWIDWTAVGPAVRHLKLRQAPGPGNPLGRVKFHMDNPHDIYLHDTNHRELMAKDRRALSSGCIRVGDAEGLARELLRDDPRWPPERITKVLNGRQTIQVTLAVPVPVRLVYQTAWVDAQETVHFREDIYGVDRRQAAELSAARRRAEVLGGDTAPVVSPPAP